MAYTVNEYRVQVRGSLSGSEIWNNTWTFLDTVGSQNISEIATILHTFYADLAGFAQWSNGWSAVGATAKNLNTGVLTELTWEPVTGPSTSGLLPHECGIRVSLTGPGNVHGGPFICGLAQAALDTDGTWEAATITNLLTALETMADSLTTAGWQLRIDRPTADVTVAVTQGRVGSAVDIIRKRGNDIAEQYLSFSVS